MKLEHCPFCNGTKIDLALIGDEFAMRCSNCGASTGWYETETEAIAAWNRRPE